MASVPIVIQLPGHDQSDLGRDEACEERGAKTPRTVIDEDDDEVIALVSRINSNGTSREAISRQSTVGAWAADRLLHLEEVLSLEDAPDADGAVAAGATEGTEGEKSPAVFELWLGSLEDALNLRRLVDHGINAILNCAEQDCEIELGPFRPVGRGRPRSHTRSMSLSDDGDNAGLGGMLALHRDQVWAEAELSAFWYSEALGYDVAYHSFSAEDEASYDFRQHFDEATNFIDTCRREGRRCLVHCVMGLNRAPAACTSFLCQGLNYSLEESIDLVSRQRGVVLSNEGFLNSLVAQYGSRQKRASTRGSVVSTENSTKSGL